MKISQRRNPEIISRKLQEAVPLPNQILQTLILAGYEWLTRIELHPA
jgi:hypothetical protein